MDPISSFLLFGFDKTGLVRFVELDLSFIMMIDSVFFLMSRLLLTDNDSGLGILSHGTFFSSPRHLLPLSPRFTHKIIFYFMMAVLLALFPVPYHNSHVLFAWVSSSRSHTTRNPPPHHQCPMYSPSVLGIRCVYMQCTTPRTMIQECSLTKPTFCL